MELEYRVYVVNTNLDDYEADLEDLDFIEIAEEEGTVYSLESFQEAFNNEEINSIADQIRIIDSSLYEESKPSLRKFLKEYHWIQLAEAVIEQMGGKENFRDSASDIVTYGIDGGYGGFVYYSDTCEFYDKNKKLILDHLEECADSMGESIIALVQSFGCLRPVEKREIERFFIYCGECEYDTQIKNALTWYAAEEVCRAYIEEIY